MELELELLFFIPKELELELNVKELELELNWKKGIDPSPDIFNEILLEIPKFFIQRNVFENVICKMVAIVIQPQYVD